MERELGANHRLWEPQAVSFACFSALVLASLLLFLPANIVLGIPVGLLFLVFAWTRPIYVLGFILALLPFQPFPTMAAEAAGVPYVALFSSLKEVGMLVCFFSLLSKRKRFQWQLPDVALCILFLIGILHACLNGNWLGFKDDFEFVIPYAVGRLLFVADDRQLRWARRALLVMSVVGIIAVLEFVVGPEPRALLTGLVSPDQLPATFRAEGFAGNRAGATLSGPLELGTFCAITVAAFAAFYSEIRKTDWLKLGAVVVGLVTTVSRTALACAILAVAIVAFRKREIRKLASVLAASTFLIAVSIPLLGLQDYVSLTRSGEDSSIEGHIQTVAAGFEQLVVHPLGSGPGTVGPRAVAKSGLALVVEDSYLVIGIEYGVLAMLLFVGFCVFALADCWRKRGLLADFAAASLVAYMVTMLVLPAHVGFPLASWIWIPVGAVLAQPTFRPNSKTRSPAHAELG